MRGFVVVLLLALSGSAASAQVFQSITLGGGVCRLERNSGSPALSTDYNFNSLTGELDLLTNGTWIISYQVSAVNPTPIDFVRVSASASMAGTGLDITLTGGVILGMGSPAAFDNSLILAPGVSGTKIVTLNITGVAGATEIRTDGDIQGVIAGSVVGRARG